MADAPAGVDLRQLLITLQQQGGSDLHLKLGRPPMLRVHGDLVPVTHPPLTAADLKGIAEQVMAPRHKKEFEEMRDVDFAIGLQGVGRFRV
ncbi:MAG: type IV pili twitching motility protein PilT, partial [Gemmatimonadaceae bacterium]